MKELLILLRAMQLYSQNAHHLVKGVGFHQDHEFFGDTYEELAKDYDDVAERIIGLFGEEHVNLQGILVGVAQKIADAPSSGTPDNKTFYEYQLKLEDRLCALVKQIIDATPTPGTEQLVGEICNKSESRSYRIKRRLI